ncbi:MAG: 5'-3' exonuclease H3TH domain-containing protein [Kofleriaceae bacterium]
MRVHLFDGTYELFRAFFGAPPAQHAGKEVGASRVFLRSLALACAKNKVTHAGVAFDTVIESFRNELFAGYKTGEGIAPELWAQFPIAERCAEALGITAWRMIEFEADDAIATAAATCAEDPRVEQVRICAVDKDMCQCVIGTHVVRWNRWEDAVLDEAGVIAKHGVEPKSIPDWLALVGDTADGIPGIQGWGNKSAAAVLMKWKRIEDIPEANGKWGVTVRGADKLAVTLRDHRQDAMLYKVLATLRTDCPIPKTVDELELRGPNMEKLAAVCDELGIAVDSIRLS